MSFCVDGHISAQRRVALPPEVTSLSNKPVHVSTTRCQLTPQTHNLDAANINVLILAFLSKLALSRFRW